MAKPFKIFLWVVGAVLLLVVGAVLAVPLFFDPNDYRDDIARAVKDATGRELTISGDLSLQLFPWLAVSVGQTRLSNAPGFGEAPMLQFEQIEAGLRLLPLLLNREIRIGTVRADGLVARLQKNAEGVTNWADLAQAEEEPAPQKEGGGIDLQNLQIGGVDIRNASVVYVDQSTGSEYRAENLMFQTGSIEAGQPVDVLFTGLVAATQPDAAADLNLQGKVLPDLEQKIYTVQSLELRVEARGAPVPAGKQNVQVSAPEVRFDQGQGTLAVPELQLIAAGMTVQATAAAQGLNTEQTRFSGKLVAENIDLRQLAKDLALALPQPTDDKVLRTASLRANYEGDTRSMRLTDVALKLDETSASGRIAITDFARQAIQFTLQVDRFDADRYLPVDEAGEAEAPKDKAQGKATDINAIEVPVQLLDKFNASGTFGIGWLKLKNLKFTDVTLKVDAAQGAPKTFDLSSKFYGGRIQHTGRITPGARPAYDVRAGIRSVNAGPVQQDFLGKALVVGTSNMSVALKSTGLKIGDIRRALDGNLTFSFADGAVQGFNLAEVLRKGRALLNREAYTAPKEPPRTDFAALEGSAKVVNGVLHTDDLNAKSPMFRFTGSGSVDLAAEQIRFLAKPTIVDTSKGQGGAELADLAGVTIPIRLTGSLYDPSVKIDWESALKAKARTRVREEKQEAREKLERKLEDKLQDFFKR